MAQSETVDTDLMRSIRGLATMRWFPAEPEARALIATALHDTLGSPQAVSQFVMHISTSGNEWPGLEEIISQAREHRAQQSPPRPNCPTCGGSGVVIVRMLKNQHREALDAVDNLDLDELAVRYPTVPRDKLHEAAREQILQAAPTSARPCKKCVPC